MSLVMQALILSSLINEHESEAHRLCNLPKLLLATSQDLKVLLALLPYTTGPGSIKSSLCFQLSTKRYTDRWYGKVRPGALKERILKIQLCHLLARSLWQDGSTSWYSILIHVSGIPSYPTMKTTMSNCEYLLHAKCYVRESKSFIRVGFGDLQFTRGVRKVGTLKRPISMWQKPAWPQTHNPTSGLPAGPSMGKDTNKW